jgi:hypothetical protein
MPGKAQIITLILIGVSVLKVPNMITQDPNYSAAQAAGLTGHDPVVPTRPLFDGKSHVGLFRVAKAEEVSKQSVGIPGLFVKNHIVTLHVKETLPPTTIQELVIKGQKGEGPEAGALGFQDWLPTNVGDQCVLAYDPDRMSFAKQFVYLGGGLNADQVWIDCKSFYQALRPSAVLYPPLVADAITRQSPPMVTFFRLVFSYDRSVYNAAEVCRAMGVYLSNSQIPPLERRKPLAHYMPSPGTTDLKALRELAAGMLTLASDLDAVDQVASAGVVFERLHGFFFDPANGAFRINPPDINANQLARVKQLLTNQTVGIDMQVRSVVLHWLFGSSTAKP